MPGEPNEGLAAQLLETAARLAEYDDSGWEICLNIRKRISKGFTFAWYRIVVELPEQIDGFARRDYRVWFETNVDNYGEIWIDGALDRAEGAVAGPQRFATGRGECQSAAGGQAYDCLSGRQWAARHAARRHFHALRHASV